MSIEDARRWAQEVKQSGRQHGRLADDNRRLVAENERLQKHFNDMDGALESSESENEHLRSENQRLLHESARWHAMWTALREFAKNHTRKLRREREAVEKENQRLRDQISVLSETYQGSRELYELVVEENQQLQRKVEFHDKMIADMHQQIEGHRRDNKRLQDEFISYRETAEEIHQCYTDSHSDSWVFEAALRRIANRSLIGSSNIGIANGPEQQRIALEALETVWTRREERSQTLHPKEDA